MRCAEAVLAAERKRWQSLESTYLGEIGDLKRTVAKQSAELNLRLTELADLYNARQQQTNDLQTACGKIGNLSEIVSKLMAAKARYEGDLAAANKMIGPLEKEGAALQAQLDETRQKYNDLLQRFNARETATVSTLEKFNSLNGELIAASADKFKLIAMVEGEKQRHRKELNHLKSAFEKQIKKIEIEATKQNLHIKDLETTRDRLGKRVEILEILRQGDARLKDVVGRPACAAPQTPQSQ